MSSSANTTTSPDSTSTPITEWEEVDLICLSRPGSVCFSDASWARDDFQEFDDNVLKYELQSWFEDHLVGELVTANYKVENALNREAGEFRSVGGRYTLIYPHTLRGYVKELHGEQTRRLATILVERAVMEEATIDTEAVVFGKKLGVANDLFYETKAVALKIFGISEDIMNGDEESRSTLSLLEVEYEHLREKAIEVMESPKDDEPDWSAGLYKAIPINPAWSTFLLEHYSPEIIGLADPKIVEIGINASGFNAKAISRRVVMSNLPKGISAQQLLNGVRGIEGILSVAFTPTNPVNETDTTSAVVEFRNGLAAKAYVDFVYKHSIEYQDCDGTSYEAQVVLIPTPSFELGKEDTTTRRFGRAIQFTAYPMAAVWFFLTMIGLDNIVRAAYIESENMNGGAPGILQLELISEFQTERTVRLIEDCKVPCYTLGGDRKVVPCFSVPDDPIASLQHQNIIPYVDPGVFRQLFDCMPYNMYVPPPAAPRRRRIPFQDRVYPSIEQLIIMEGLPINICECYTPCPWKITDGGDEYRILASRFVLIRRQSGWSIAMLGDIALLQSLTLHEQVWEQHWDMYFVNNGQVNLRKLDNYAVIAQHRRAIAAHRGLPEGTVPPPCTNCSICPPRFSSVTPLGKVMMDCKIRCVVAQAKAQKPAKKRRDSV
ncbi:Fc.00g093200.m01.CDS01 [Cosmosporella sp. VM-42]